VLYSKRGTQENRKVI